MIYSEVIDGIIYIQKNNLPEVKRGDVICRGLNKEKYTIDEAIVKDVVEGKIIVDYDGLIFHCNSKINRGERHSEKVKQLFKEGDIYKKVWEGDYYVIKALSIF